MMIANANATPKAARLIVGASSLAIIAARYGPSAAIMSQVLASGAQKVKIFRWVSVSVIVWVATSLPAHSTYRFC